MIKPMGTTTWSIGEHRKTYLFKEVGPNLKTWGGDTMETFVNGPLKKKDYVGATMGSFAAAAALVLEAPDQIYAGIVDKKLEPPKGTRTGRDLRELGSDVVNFRPVSTVLDGLRLFSSIPMDIIQTVGGFQRGNRGAMQNVLKP